MHPNVNAAEFILCPNLVRRLGCRSLAYIGDADKEKAKVLQVQVKNGYEKLMEAL
jgi:hypothetical protein